MSKVHFAFKNASFGIEIQILGREKLVYFTLSILAIMALAYLIVFWAKVWILI